jgi:hypothetical protein
MMALNNVAQHFPLIALDAQMNTVSRFKVGRLAVIPPHFKEEETSKRNKEGKAVSLNPLNTELNLICHMLALLAAHHILHVSGIRGNQT